MLNSHDSKFACMFYRNNKIDLFGLFFQMEHSNHQVFFTENGAKIGFESSITDE